MKALYIIGGVLCGLFSFAQLLQLIGLIGAGFNVAGIGFTIIGAVLSYACFRKVFGPGNGN
jgi:hypothetical protein